MRHNSQMLAFFSKPHSVGITKHTEIFSAVKIEKFTGKNMMVLFFAQNIDCGYTLERYPQLYVLNKKYEK